MWTHIAATAAAVLVVAVGSWVILRVLARFRVLEAEQAALRAALDKAETALAAVIRKHLSLERRLKAPHDRGGGPANKALETGRTDCACAAAPSGREVLAIVRSSSPRSDTPLSRTSSSQSSPYRTDGPRADASSRTFMRVGSRESTSSGSGLRQVQAVDEGVQQFCKLSPEQAMRILEGLPCGGQATRTSSRSSVLSHRRLSHISSTSSVEDECVQTFPLKRVVSDSTRYDRMEPTTHAPKRTLAPYRRKKAD